MTRHEKQQAAGDLFRELIAWQRRTFVATAALLGLAGTCATYTYISTKIAINRAVSDMERAFERR